MSASINISTDVVLADTRTRPGTITLPYTTDIPYRTFTIKDAYGTFGVNSLTVTTQGTDRFEDGTNTKVFTNNFSYISLYGNTAIGKWQLLGSTQLTSINASSITTSTIRAGYFIGDGKYLSNFPGVCSLSSIVSYGLSSVNGGRGISSLSSIISYGLSSVNGGQGISSLSSIISYGLSSVNGGQGISSLSSIISYGLSSVNQGITTLSNSYSNTIKTVQLNTSIMYTSTIYASTIYTSNIYASNIYAFSNIFTSNIYFTSNTVVANIFASNISSPIGFVSTLTINTMQFFTGSGFVNFGAVRAVGISSMQENTNALYAASAYVGNTSTVNAVYFAGLSNTYDRTVITEISTSTAGVQELLLYKGGGTSDRIRIQTTGEFRVEAGAAARTWPYNLQATNPSIYAAPTLGYVGINTAAPGAALDVYGVGGVAGTVRSSGVSTIQIVTSSIQAFYFLGDGRFLSNVPGGGLSSLSSIVSYGLSSVNAGFGVSSLSTIISYGLSTVYSGAVNPGTSSLSTIISYGLSTVYRGAVNPGVSSVSTTISYGLSSVYSGAVNPGTSSLSTIISYGLSSVYAGAVNPGTSSLSSIISFGLSTLAAGNLSNISTPIGFVSSLTINTMQFLTGSGFVNFGAIRAVGISSMQENTNALYAASAYVGNTSTVNAVYFAGLSNTYDRTVITEISTSTAGVQELLLYKGGGTSDRVRIQTTGEFRVETVGTRTWPYNLAATNPNIYVQATTGYVGINTASPATGLDIVGATLLGTVRSPIMSTVQLYASTVSATLYPIYYNTVVSTIGTAATSGTTNTMYLPATGSGSYYFITTSSNAAGSNAYINLPTGAPTGSLYVIKHKGGSNTSNTIRINQTAASLAVSTTSTSVYSGIEWLSLGTTTG